MDTCYWNLVTWIPSRYRWGLLETSCQICKGCQCDSVMTKDFSLGTAGNKLLRIDSYLRVGSNIV
jgi:hypothetical protein